MSSAVGVVLLAYAALAVAALRLALSYRSAIYTLRRLWRWGDDGAQAYQYHEVPRHISVDRSAEREENPLFAKAAAYVSSLPSLEDADAASVLSSSSSKKTNGGFLLRLGPGHTARDVFQGARLSWTYRRDKNDEALVLRVRRHDRTRVLRPYVQHVESVADEMEQRRRELRLYANAGGVDTRTGAPQWASAPFTHPATLDTMAMDPDIKARVRADLEAFAKGRAYYHRLGRVWRRSYLLHGPPGTGKSTFAAAMARFLGYDVYEVDLSRAGDLRALLMRTTPRSLILVEDLDRHLLLHKDDDADATRVLSFMDGVASCCGEERLMVFTMRGGKESLGAAVARPGRLDVHIRFALCDFEPFKALAGTYLGLKNHKLYPQVEEGFNIAGDRRFSPAELGEIMLANRTSPSRALRTVITKLQHVSGESPRPPPVRLPHRRITSWSGGAAGQWDQHAVAEETAPAGSAGGGLFGKDAPMREFKKLYGLIKTKGRREGAGVVPLEDEAPPPIPSIGRVSSSNNDKER